MNHIWWWQELFQQTVGPLKSASLAYDSKGKSKGVATIQFVKAADSNKAYTQYNKRLIDGSGLTFLFSLFFNSPLLLRVE